MRFCPACGHPLERRIPPLDHLPRFVCPACQTIHYQNPRIVAGTVPLAGSRVLLCRRAIAPRLGYWTLPAGFMECQESTQEAAIRETREEAGAAVRLLGLHAVIDLPRFDQVHLFYRAVLLDRAWHPGFETLEVRLFPLTAIPWAELAFASVEAALRHLVAHWDPAPPPNTLPPPLITTLEVARGPAPSSSASPTA